MPRVVVTRNLAAVFPQLQGHEELIVQAQTAAGVIIALDKRFPGLGAYVVDERGQLRKHVNVFVDGELVHDRRALSDPVGEDSPVHIIQALSGG